MKKLRIGFCVFLVALIAGVSTGSFVAQAAPAVEDLFTRADNASSAGSAPTGQAWTAHLCTFGIASNELYQASNCGGSGIKYGIATVDPGAVGDVAVDITTAQTGNTVSAGLIFRYVDTSNFWTFFCNKSSGGTVQWFLQKTIANVTTTISNGSSGSCFGTSMVGSLAVVDDGSTLDVKLSGSTVYTGSQSELNSATRVGVFCTYVSTSGANSCTGWRWDNFTAGEAAPEPTCQNIGITFEYREAGVGNEWVDVVDNEWPPLAFGDSIRWSMELPTGVQVDHLAFFQHNRTPIRVTGDAPNYRNYELEGFSRQLISAVTLAETELTDQVASGIGVSWAIRPGDGLSQEVGPFTHTGTFTFLAESDTVPEFHIQCHIYGSPDLEELRMDGESAEGGTSVNSGDGCQETRVVWKPSHGTETQWGFHLLKGASTTDLDTVEWRYMPESFLDPLDTAWTDISPAALPENLDVDATLLIDREDAPNPYLVQWRFTCAVAGGGTRSVEDQTEAPGNGLGADAQESCYGQALGSMELTRPASWVAGAGRMAVCLVEFLFVPDSTTVSEEFDGFVDSLEEQFPFSLGFMLIDFTSTLADELQSASGSGCFSGIGSYPIGGTSVAVDDVCIGEGMDVSGGQRDLMAVLFIAPILWSVVAHAYGMFANGPAWSWARPDSRDN